MARSKIKLSFVHRSQFIRFFYNQKKKKIRKACYKCIIDKNSKLGPYYFFWKRASVINRKLINKRIGLYNGYIFHILKITDKHKGFKLGEFSTTRRTAKHAGKQRQIKKRDKNKGKDKLKVNKYSVQGIFVTKNKISNRQKARELKKA